MSEWHKIFRNGPVLTHSPEEMRELGKQIGKILMPGEILGVVGELGAGKTHLTQGIMEGLGSSEAAASPTISLRCMSMLTDACRHAILIFTG